MFSPEFVKKNKSLKLCHPQYLWPIKGEQELASLSVFNGSVLALL